MTPKEKADELIKHFKNIGSRTQLYSGGNYETTTLNTCEAVQCAMFLCTEMIKHTPLSPSIKTVDTLDLCAVQAVQFWKQVRNELKELL